MRAAIIIAVAAAACSSSHRSTSRSSELPATGTAFWRMGSDATDPGRLFLPVLREDSVFDDLYEYRLAPP